jgi:hypothetical protein
MKSSVTQIKNSMERITNRLEPVEERTSATKDKAEELLYSDSNKGKEKVIIITTFKTPTTKLRDKNL